MSDILEDPTPAEVARELGLSPAAVRNWCQAGWGYKVGPHGWRIPRERIEDILAARERARERQ